MQAESKGLLSKIVGDEKRAEARRQTSKHLSRMEPGNKLPTMLQQHFWVGLWFCCCCLFVNTEVSIQRSKLQASCSAMKRTSSFMEFHSQNKPLVFRSSLSLGMQTTCQIHLYKIITVPNESRRRSFRCFEYLRGNPIAQMLGLLSLLTLL